jgi:hypothetical protein
VPFVTKKFLMQCEKKVTLYQAETLVPIFHFSYLQILGFSVMNGTKVSVKRFTADKTTGNLT